MYGSMWSTVVLLRYVILWIFFEGIQSYFYITHQRITRNLYFFLRNLKYFPTNTKPNGDCDYIFLLYTWVVCVFKDRLLEL